MPASPDDPRRAEARLLFADGTSSVASIAARVGASVSTIRRWARDDGWPPRARAKAAGRKARRGRQRAARQQPSSLPAPMLQAPPPSSPAPRPAGAEHPGLIDRLYRIVEHNLSILEGRMADTDPQAGAEPERDMRALGNIVRSVEKLKELEPGHGSVDSAPKSGRAPVSPEEEDELRLRIVERLLKLRERRGAGRGPRGGDGGPVA